MAIKKPVVKKAATKKATVKKPVAKTAKSVKKPVKRAVKKAQPVEQTLEFQPVSSFLSLHASMDPEQQAAMIAEQTRRAFDVEAFVQFNVAQTQVARSIVE